MLLTTLDYMEEDTEKNKVFDKKRNSHDSYEDEIT
jgi:hypothetical protein